MDHDFRDMGPFENLPYTHVNIGFDLSDPLGPGEDPLLEYDIRKIRYPGFPEKAKVLMMTILGSYHFLPGGGVCKCDGRPPIVFWFPPWHT